MLCYIFLILLIRLQVIRILYWCATYYFNIKMNNEIKDESINGNVAELENAKIKEKKRKKEKKTKQNIKNLTTGKS